MKLILQVIIIVLLSSYTLDTQKQIENNKEELVIDQNQIDKRLLGKWGIYVQVIKGTNVLCNACPEIEFDSLNRTILTLPSGDKEKYEWNTSNSILHLKLIEKETPEAHFIDSKYKMSFTQRKEFMELVLSLNKNRQYILRKSDR
ncbi:hypothetical protein [Bernardetia sp.]|uniref:hypothetical protein n=1 Tax=Bernardetia sp. TaxID=1937974 RepID=UPI0025C502DE|nr:hypothetical protein [Bernardetia sp.]